MSAKQQLIGEDDDIPALSNIAPAASVVVPPGSNSGPSDPAPDPNQPMPFWVKAVIGLVVVVAVGVAIFWFWMQFTLVKAASSGSVGAAGVLGAEALSGALGNIRL